QNLNYLSIDNWSVKSSIILQNFGQILPTKLKYLNLTLVITSDFEVFLKNFQNTFIDILLIRRMWAVDGGEYILPFIEKYIMKKKRVKYLAFRDSDLDLFYLNDVVKKFKL